MRVLALLTDAFGGHGGIAVYNRDMLTALCSHPLISEVVALPRSISNPLGPLPQGLTHVTGAANGPVAYLAALCRTVVGSRGFNLILCGHINLMPLARLVGAILRAPVILEIYGIDAWQPTTRALVSRSARSAMVVISISGYTRDRFLSWAGVPEDRVLLLPNAIHLDAYGVGDRPGYLLDRYGLRGRRILMTFGRLVSKERAKGFDEVLDILPELRRTHPDLAYVIAGDGPDRDRLEARVRALGIKEHVVFTGRVDEAEKADLYRMCDLYVMPSRGEGFGFVFLEAMACGIPVIASRVDGSRDAVRDGLLGPMVDPDDAEALRDAVLAGLEASREVPEGLAHFGFPAFTQRVHRIVDEITGEPH